MSLKRPRSSIVKVNPSISILDNTPTNDVLEFMEEHNLVEGLEGFQKLKKGVWVATYFNERTMQKTLESLIEEFDYPFASEELRVNQKSKVRLRGSRSSTQMSALLLI